MFNKSELDKVNQLKLLKVMQLIKQMVMKQIKGAKEKRVNMQKEGLIGNDRCRPSEVSNKRMSMIKTSFNPLNSREKLN
jgi:hypothetical protein